MLIEHDYLVVGLGAFGSAALWRLAERGVDVAGIEQFDIGHNLGSSHGTTRLFRIACQEHPLLSPIATKSLSLWQQLGTSTATELIDQTGCLNVGHPGLDPIAGTLSAAQMSNLSVTEISHRDLVENYPSHAGWGPDDVGVWDPSAGLCYPETIVETQVIQAKSKGAAVYPNTKVIDIDFSSHMVSISTATVTFRAQHVILAAGAWLARMLPKIPLAPRRTPLNWFKAAPGSERDYRLDRFPAFVRTMPSGMQLWGHGSSDKYGIKLGMWDNGTNFAAADPDHLDRYIHQDTDIEELSTWVTQAFPGVNPAPHKVAPCMITNSPDGQFVVGRSSEYPGAIIAGGDSAHGFKHSVGLGEIVARMALGEDSFCEIDFMNPERFVKNRIGEKA